MDSKMRRLAILGSVAVILLVSLLVFYANREPVATGQSQNGQPQNNTSQNELPANGQIQNTQNSSASNVGVDSTDREPGQIGDNLSAFLEDSTFFDEEENPFLEELLNQKNRLSLMVTSIEKDLRIQIVDALGEPVKGESFYVALEGLGEYKDLDKDGIIYIGDLNAGEYYVELMPIDGYHVPVSETKVRVKEKVEYLAIEDISLLIKTEEEVDAEAEDTAVQDALEDADKTEVSTLRPVSGKARAGIDVSKYQGEIDWDKVANSGVEFVIIRAGYRGSVSGSLVEDPYFRENIRGAKAAGLDVGVYFFTQAVNEVEAVEEASAVLSLVEEYELDYPIFIDTEGAGGNGRADGLNRETRTLVCDAFCRTVENAGYRGGIYASRNWYNNNLDMNRLDNYYIWLAEYREAPLYQGYYAMWQYTSKGHIDGIEGSVDLNISYE